MVEQSVAYHLHPNCQSTLALAGPILLGKMERITTFMCQKMYKSAAQSVKNRNVVTLLRAYQAELFQDMGHFLDEGSPKFSYLGGDMYRHGPYLPCV